MNADDRKLLTHLFTKATELLEDAVAPAVAGQSSRNTAKTFADSARQLRGAARNLAAIAEAAEAILRMSETPPPKRKKAR
jgi:hypothetical protein